MAKQFDNYDVAIVGDIVMRHYSIWATMGEVTRVEGSSCWVKWSKQTGENSYMWTDEEQLKTDDVIVMATKRCESNLRIAR